MRKFILAFLFLLMLVPMPARAESRFLVFGDSITAEGANTNSDWGYRLHIARPDLGGFCRNGVIGRYVHQGLADIDAVMFYCSGFGTVPVTDVFILLGANDAKLIPQPTPEATATQLRQIAAKVVAFGATPHILTLTPIITPFFWPPNSNSWGGQVSAWLYMLNGIGPSYDVVAVRDKFTAINWLSCATDGVHPNKSLCKQTIADAVKDTVP